MKPRSIAIAPAAALLIAACSSTSSEALCERTGGPVEELSLPRDLADQVDAAVGSGMDAMDAVGLTTAVQCNESPTYVAGYGLADLATQTPAMAETVYEIGSITKQFVAYESLQLEGTGAISLADEVGVYLP